MNLKNKIAYYAAWAEYITKVINTIANAVRDLEIPQKKDYND